MGLFPITLTEATLTDVTLTEARIPPIPSRRPELFSAAGATVFGLVGICALVAFLALSNSHNGGAVRGSRPVTWDNSAHVTGNPVWTALNPKGWPQQTINIILLIAPLLIGAVIAAVNAEDLNDLFDRLEAWLRRRKQRTAEQKGWFSKKVIAPLLWSVVAVCDWTTGFLHRGLKTGVRVTAILYVVAVWLLLLYVALIVVLVILAMAAILFVVYLMLNESQGHKASGFSPTNIGRAVRTAPPDEPEAPQHVKTVPPVTAARRHGEEEHRGSKMGHRFEYEEVAHPISGLVSGLLSALPGEDSSSCWKCTIYDGDTDNKLSDGLGNTQFEAKWEAQAKL